MKVVYVAGPYRAESEYGVHLNIRKAEDAAAEIWKLGAVALCPHKNSAYLGGACSDNVFLNGGIELLRRSDAVYVLPDSETSKGTQTELIEAVGRDIPIFCDISVLAEWVLV